MFDIFKSKAKAKAKAKANQSANNTEETPIITDDPNNFRGTKVSKEIDPSDGKTKTCNRARTFDNFVHQQHLGQDVEPRKARHNIEVARAIAKFKNTFTKSSGTADRK